MSHRLLFPPAIFRVRFLQELDYTPSHPIALLLALRQRAESMQVLRYLSDI